MTALQIKLPSTTNESAETPRGFPTPLAVTEHTANGDLDSGTHGYGENRRLKTTVPRNTPG